MLVRRGVDDDLTPLLRPALATAELLLGHVSCLARHPVRAARFAFDALRSATTVARKLNECQAQAVFLGAAAHAVLPLDQPGSAGFGLALLALAHGYGWPIPRGGSQAIADALAERLRSLGGEIETGHAVRSLSQLPKSRVVLCDVTPRQLLGLVGDRLPPREQRRLRRWRYGPGVFKLDYALDAPIPWLAPEVADAGTVHIGSAAEIVESERAVWEARHPQRPFVLLAQQSLFDDTRAPAGKHTAWAYCHVPHASAVDMTDAIEAQVERFAPGFGELVLARHAMGPAELEARNRNLVGGDLNGGLMDLRQVYTRPVARLVPYRTPRKGVYICSAATPPGGGVHGMCGVAAAKVALRDTGC